MNTTTHNDLMTETGLSDYQYTISLMLFLIAYGAFEAPSNMLLKQLRPSRWIAFLMVAWGALTISLGASTNPATVMALRFLLGVFEAGLFPGLVYYLTFWYRADERSMRVAWILASATLAGAFGGAIANGVGHLNQVVRGVSGWRCCSTSRASRPWSPAPLSASSSRITPRRRGGCPRTRKPWSCSGCASRAARAIIRA